MYSDEICGKCKWHVRDDIIEKDWICANEDSEYSGCMTEYRDTCDDFEERIDYTRTYNWGNFT